MKAFKQQNNNQQSYTPTLQQNSNFITLTGQANHWLFFTLKFLLVLLLAMTLMNVALAKKGYYKYKSTTTICDTPNPNEDENSLKPGTYHNVKVKPGADCILHYDDIESGVHIKGNFLSDGANEISISGQGVRIDGDFTLKNTLGTSSVFGAVKIGGNVLATNNFLPITAEERRVLFGFPGVTSGGMTIDGNVTIKNNTGRNVQLVANIGGKVIFKNNLVSELAFGCDNVKGNINVKNNTIVKLEDGTRGDLFVLSDCRPLSASLNFGTFKGNVKVKNNSVEGLAFVGSSTTKRNFRIKGNTAAAIETGGSTIGRNFSCKFNTPDPTFDFFGPNLEVKLSDNCND